MLGCFSVVFVLMVVMAGSTYHAPDVHSYYSSTSAPDKKQYHTHRPAVYIDNSIFSREKENDIFRDVHFPIEGSEKNAHPVWRRTINELFQKFKPSNHSFFNTLATADPKIVKNKGFLNEFYFRYQAAMHATRAAVYRTPYLNTPSLRRRRIAIIIDDDALDGNSHHKYLEDMFRHFGATPAHEDEFGDIEPLIQKLDTETASFARFVEATYPLSTGAWCIAEVLSDNWLSALAKSFEPFFPDVWKQEYFDEVFTGHVEIIHMLETVALTEDVLARYPHMLQPSINHAKQMAEQLNLLWTNLERLVRHPEPFLSKD